MQMNIVKINVFYKKSGVLGGFSNILNKSSAKCAESWGCHFKYEYEDNVNEITKVYVITKEEWNNLKNKSCSFLN